MYRNTRLLASGALFALCSVTACGQATPGDEGTPPATGIGSISDGSSGSEAGDDDSAGTGGTSGAESGAESGSDDAPKFDLGEGDDGPTGCGDPGDGGGGGIVFSYIWIANSPDGTVSKIDTQTGAEVGRYRTSSGSNSPSRTSVNQFGDVAVGNRGAAGSLTKIAAQTEDCVDSNGVPGIQTSTGAGDVLPYGEDECVLWNTALPSPSYDHGPRGVAWEGGEIDADTCMNTVPNPRVWVSWHGGGNTIEVRRIDGTTGAVLDTAAVQGGGGRTYGGAVNGEGDFWVATRGGQDNLIHVDSDTMVSTVYNVPAGNIYGMTVDKEGNPWAVTYNDGANHVWRLDADTGMFTDVGQGGYYRGVQIDRDGRVWIAGNNPCRLSLADADGLTLVDDNIPLPGCSTPVGVSIDSEGYVWVVDQGTSSAYKVDPDSYAVVLTVSGLVQPYTYSDMTGAGLDLVVNPPG